MIKRDGNRPGRRGLRKKIVIAILIVGIFPLVLGVYLTYLNGIDALTRSIGANFKAMAKETANKLYIILEEELSEAKGISVLHEIIETVERSNFSYRNKGNAEIEKKINTSRRRWNNAAKDDPLVKEILNNKVSTYLKSLPHYPKEYIAILVTDEKGALVAVTDRGYDYYQGDKKWWQVISKDREERAFVSDITYDKKIKDYLMEIAVPVYSIGKRNKKIIGAINIIYKADQIFNIIGDIKIEKSGHANLVSGNGEIIFCPIFPPRSHNISEKLIKEIRMRDSGWGIAEDDGHGGINSIVGFAPVRLINQLDSDSFSGNSWYVLIRQHPDETYAPIHNLLLKVYISGFFLVGILVMMGFYASKKIVEPILLLKEETELIGRGNFDHRVAIRTGDEIESLADEFNFMAEGLKTYHSQLKTERDKLERIILSAGEGIIVADAEHNVVMLNPVAEKMLGVTMNEVKGKSIFPCHSSPQKVQQLLRDKVALPLHITTSIGSEIVEINVTLIKSGEEIIGSMMIMRDITLMKYMEDELKRYSGQLEKIVYERTREIGETKEYLEYLLENANDVIYTLNMDGIFTYVNQKIEMWGYGKEELIGKSFNSLLVEEGIKNEIKSPYEVRIRNKGGEARDALIRTSPLKGNEGTVIGFLGIATDVTDKNRLEEQVMRAEKLAAVGQLSMGIAHEINNPLSGMLNCIRALNEEGENALLRTKYLVLLEKGLNRIESVIKQLLGFAKEHKFEFTLYKLDDIIIDTLKLIEYKIEKENVKLQLSLNCKEKNYLLPVNHIQQVILNIGINAIQAMPRGGTLFIDTHEDTKNLIVSISDTGMGIPRENLKRIFDPFFTTKDIGIGTGLGLSLSYGIVEKLGGEIKVESIVNKGSTFTVIIPIRRENGKGRE